MAAKTVGKATSTLDEAVHFALYSDLSTDQVAERLGVSAEAVKRSLRRAGLGDLLSRLDSRGSGGGVRRGRIVLGKV